MNEGQRLGLRIFLWLYTTSVTLWPNLVAGQGQGQVQVQVGGGHLSHIGNPYGFPPSTFISTSPGAMSRTMNLDSLADQIEGADSQSIKLDIWKSVGMKGLTPPETYNSGQNNEFKNHGKNGNGNRNRHQSSSGAGSGGNGNRTRQAFEQNLMRFRQGQQLGGGLDVQKPVNPAIQTLIKYATQCLFFLRYFLYTLIVQYLPYPYNYFLYAFGVGHLVVSGIEQL